MKIIQNQDHYLKFLFIVLVNMMVSCEFFKHDLAHKDRTNKLLPLELKRNGSFFEDEHGATVVLRGVNLVNKKEPYAPKDMGFSEDDVQLIKKMGHNVVRLGLCWAAIEPTRGKYNKTYMNSVFETVELLSRHSIYTLIDLHQDAYSKNHGGYGMPEWSALGIGNPAGVPDPIGFPKNEFGGIPRTPPDDNLPKLVSTLIDEDFDAFWQNKKGIQDAYIKMLSFVVTQIKTQLDTDVRNSIVGIEVMNEPFPGVKWTECTDFKLLADGNLDFSKGCENFDSSYLTAFYKKAISAIRGVDKKIMIWLDPVNLFGLNSPTFIKFDEFTDTKGLVFSYHNYFPLDFEGPFNYLKKLINETDAPIGHVMTEFGANNNVSAWDSILPIADKIKVSWMYWTYANNPQYKFSDTGGVIPLDGKLQGLVYDPAYQPDEIITMKDGTSRKNINTEILNALSRPYPKQTPGYPVNWLYDQKTKEFRYWFTYARQNIKNSTLKIATPDVIYPQGVRVVLTIESEDRKPYYHSFESTKETLEICFTCHDNPLKIPKGVLQSNSIVTVVLTTLKTVDKKK